MKNLILFILIFLLIELLVIFFILQCIEHENNFTGSMLLGFNIYFIIAYFKNNGNMNLE